jgi:acyl carrier protein
VADVKTQVREFIASEIMYDESPAALTDDTKLLGGIMDSLGLMQLVSYLEEQFEVEIDDSEVTVDNFQTINDIDRLVSSKAQVG